jgi:hypothetical protein
MPSSVLHDAIMVIPLETRSIKKKIPFQCLLIGFLIAKIIVSVQSAEIHQAADALKVVLNDEPTRDRIDNIHSLKSKTDYLDQLGGLDGGVFRRGPSCRFCNIE